MNFYVKTHKFPSKLQIRGAANALCKLLEQPTTDDTKPCVVTHSTGNHGQGLACAAQNLGVKTFVVLPRTAPLCKQHAIEEYGAIKVLCEPSEQVRKPYKVKTQFVHFKLHKKKKVRTILYEGLEFTIWILHGDIISTDL